MSELPGILAEIAAEVGPDAARRIGLRLAGQVVKFPSRTRLQKPARDTEIRRLAVIGWTVEALALRFNVSERWIRTILGRDPKKNS
jgi:Mor family transcriptional regulator